MYRCWTCFPVTSERKAVFSHLVPFPERLNLPLRRLPIKNSFPSPIISLLIWVAAEPAAIDLSKESYRARWNMKVLATYAPPWYISKNNRLNYGTRLTARLASSRERRTKNNRWRWVVQKKRVRKRRRSLWIYPFFREMFSLSLTDIFIRTIRNIYRTTGKIGWRNKIVIAWLANSIECLPLIQRDSSKGRESQSWIEKETEWNYWQNDCCELGLSRSFLSFPKIFYPSQDIPRISPDSKCLFWMPSFVSRKAYLRNDRLG